MSACTRPTGIANEPPSFEGDPGECYHASHETPGTGRIDPHWHCAAECRTLHLTIIEAEDCPVEPKPKRPAVIYASVDGKGEGLQ